MHVAITGASSGIGEAIARAYAARGAKLTLVARRKEVMEKLAAELNTQCHVVGADLGDPSQALAWLAASQEALGPIDVLINNAGVQIVGPTHTTDPADGEALIRVDLLTPLRLTHALLPAMLQRRSGTIVDVASLAAIAPTPGMIWYNAAKAGLAAASESLRGELLGTGVHVVTVYPGPVRTPMEQTAVKAYGGGKDLQKLPTGNTKTLAQLVLTAVDKKQSRIIYPAPYWVARWFPGFTRFVMDRATPKLAADAVAVSSSVQR